MERLVKACPEVAIDGGPCSGKTTGLATISEKFQDWGYRVFVLPELATMIFGGIPDIGQIAAEDFQKYFQIEKEMLQLHMAMRRHFHRLADLFTSQKTLILSDRGAASVLGYVPSQYRRTLLEETGYTLFDVRDSYDTVLHMVTAADGAEECYTLANNRARYESPELARQRDKSLLEAWMGCEHLKIINNSTGFDEKIQRALRAIAQGLGIPVPLEIERRYLLRKMPDLASLGVHAQEVFIEQRYLLSEGDEELRIRQRSQWGSNVYYRTQKRRISDRVRQETSAIITPLEYVDLQRFQDPESWTIEKRRFCFVYRHQYFELDMVLKPRPYIFLEIELTEEQDEPQLPLFLDIEKEVTGDSRYSNYAVAHEMG